MKKQLQFKNFLQTLLLLAFLGLGQVGFGQVWNYDFGTGTGTFNSTTASTTFLPTPPTGGGTSRVRLGTNPGSILLVNPGVALGSNSEMQFTSNTGSTSTSKMSIYDYTASKIGYAKFKIAFNGGTNGVYYFTMGDGATFSDNNAIANAQVFAGIQFSLGASSAITYNVLNNTTYGTTGISNSTTLFTQSISNEYLIEVYINNNTTSTTYQKGGSNSLANATWDLWVNGVKVGNNLAKGALGTNANIDSFAFNHQSSVTSPGTLYIDDIEYSNTLPTTPTYALTYNGNTNTSGTAPATANYEANANVTVASAGTLVKTGFTFSGWNTAADGTGTPYAAGSTLIMPANAVTLYAQWAAITTPTITTTGTLAALNTIYGTPSSNTSFSVSGTALTDDILVTAPAGFEVSTVAGSGFGSSVTLPQSSGTVASTTIFVRLAATTAVGSYSGNVVLTSTGAATVNVATVSSTVATKALTISGLTASPKEYDTTTNVVISGTPTYTGLENGETFTVIGSVTYAFATATAGVAKAITRTGTYDAPSTNYTVTQPNFIADITKKALTILAATAQDKNFDGTTTATLTGTLDGVISPDVITLTLSGNFDTAAVGTLKPVTSTSTISSTVNYTLTQPTGLTAAIIAVVPNAPVIGTITPSSGQLSVAFTAPTNNGGTPITNYAYSIDNGVTFTEVAPAQTTSPIVITGLTNGVTYPVVIYAINAQGNGANSNTVNGTPNLVSAATDFFRSIATGNWSTTASWESSNDAVLWYPATLTPTATANTITIRNGHTITSNAVLTADQLVVETGGVFITTANFTLADGAGIDLSVNGTYSRNLGGFTQGTSTIQFGVNSVYNHGVNGGALPIATWDVTSTCNITGVTGATPTNFGQTFGRFTWNCPNQAVFISINDSNFNPKGLVAVFDTSSFALNLDSDNIIRTYNLEGGLLIGANATFNVTFRNSGTTVLKTLNVTGDVNVNGGGFLLADGTSTPATGLYRSIVNLNGNLILNGATSSVLVGNTAYLSQLNFVGGGTKTFSSDADTPFDGIHLEVVSGTTLNLLTDMKLRSTNTSDFDRLTVNGTLNASTFSVVAGSGTQSRAIIASGATLLTNNTNGLGGSLAAL